MTLKLCPFCGETGAIHETYFQPELAESEDDVPKDAQVLREVRYSSGKWYIEFRRKAYKPQCIDPSCIGRTNKLYRTKEEAISAWNRRMGQ